MVLLLLEADVGLLWDLKSACGSQVRGLAAGALPCSPHEAHLVVPAVQLAVAYLAEEEPVQVHGVQLKSTDTRPGYPRQGW